MATSLLRLGRLGSLKCLQQDGWGSLRTPLTAAFSTKAEAPKKPAKKASSKTLEASDERAALLAYKTTVAFPTRLSAPGFLSQGVSLGEYEQSRNSVTDASAESVTTAHAKQAESVADDSAKVQTESCDVGAAAAEAPLITETATEKDATSTTGADVKARKSEVASKDDDATSSSSSSSDSDSDSDSDDEKPDKTEVIEPVVQREDKRQEEMPSAVSEEPASDVKTAALPERVQPFVTEGAIKRAPTGAPDVAKAERESTSEQVPSSSTAAASSEEIIDPAPVLCRAESIKAQAAVLPEKDAGVAVKSLEDSGAIPEPVTEGASDVPAEPTPKIVFDSATKVASEPEVAIKAAPETMEAVPERVQPFVPERAPEGAIKRAPNVAEAVSESTSERVPSSSTAVASSEELVDPAPVITVAEEVGAEPDVAAAPEEAAAAPAPEPVPEPEPFD
ncbi:hypothetical protein AMELA_G00093100, partial [Ameiurus melas]